MRGCQPSPVVRKVLSTSRDTPSPVGWSGNSNTCVQGSGDAKTCHRWGWKCCWSSRCSLQPTVLELTGLVPDPRVHDERGGNDRQSNDCATRPLAARRRPGDLHRPAHGRVVHAARLRSLVGLGPVGWNGNSNICVQACGHAKTCPRECGASIRRPSVSTHPGQHLCQPGSHSSPARHLGAK